MIRDHGDEIPSDALFSALAGATDDVLWMLTADRDSVVFMSDAYEDVWGRSLAALRSNPGEFVDGIHPADRGAVETMLDAAAAGEPEDVEARVDAAADRWVHIQARPVVRDGAVTHIAGTARDVTERRLRERELDDVKRQLEQSEAELQRFAYIASHDLQEPLRMVRSYLDLLESEYGDELDAEAREFIDFAVDGAERMKGLIEGLLEFSRVETRGGEFVSVDADEVAETARKSLSMTIDEADATVETESLPTVTADPTQLSRVFEALVENAIEFTDDGPPTVEIRGAERDDAYVFAVEDDGGGFPDDPEELFDIFARGPNAAGTGTGVGLAISNRIVERHGGEMWIESTSEAGATVCFSLAKDPD